jgi:putative transposase
MLDSMPTGLKRYYGGQDMHYITCSCYRRDAWLGVPSRRTLFLKILEEVRRAYDFVVAGYVVMPEHIHLLVSEPEKGNLSLVMQVLKQRVARSVLSELRLGRVPTLSQRARKDGAPRRISPEHFWQARFYDFNVWSAAKHVEKLRYIHRNPVRRGLVLEPEQWEWSSFRTYAYGEPGLVVVNAPGSARLRVRGATA